MRRRIPALALAALALTPAAASAQAAPGAPVKLHLDADTLQAPMNGRMPASVRFSAPAGTQVDWKTLSSTCDKSLQAKGTDCSSRSRIGSGTVALRVTDPRDGSFRDVNLLFNLFLSQRQGIIAYLMQDDGSLQMAYGSASALGGFSASLLIPQIVDLPLAQTRLLRVTADLGTSRVFTTKSRVWRGTGKRRHRVVVRRKVRRDLLRLPSTCPATGAWPVSIGFTYPDGSAATSGGLVPCGPS